MKIKIKKLSPNAVIPTFATSGSSGFDFYALEDVLIEPQATKLIRTGLAFDVGSGYELQVRPRSGLSLKSPLRLANAPGTVDSDFRGEVCVIITNISLAEAFTVHAGDRIAQGVICPVIRPDIEVVGELDESIRGAGGFGSTGT